MPNTANSYVEPSSRRCHPRVPGPFDGRRGGLLTLQLRIHDLSLGGCLIQARHHQAPGRRFTMEIELPVEGCVEIQAESLYEREGYGFANRFVEMSDDARQRLERTIDRLGEAQTAC